MFKGSIYFSRVQIVGKKKQHCICILKKYFKEEPWNIDGKMPWVQSITLGRFWKLVEGVEELQGFQYI